MDVYQDPKTIRIMKNIAENYITEKGKSSAFPFNSPTGYYESGMTLKEYYSGLALQSLIQLYAKPKEGEFHYEWMDICRHAEAFGRLMVRAMAEEQAKNLENTLNKINQAKESDVQDSEEQTGGWG